MPPSVLVAAVAVVGAVRVLTEGPVPAGVPSTLVHVTLTPARRAENEDRPLQWKPDYARPVTARDKSLTQSLPDNRLRTKSSR